MERRRRGAPEKGGGHAPPTTPPLAPRRGRQYTQSVGRALAILQAFRPTRPALSLTDLARAVAIDKATVRRLLLTMQEHGFIEQDAATRQYTLGPAVLEIGAAVRLNRELREIVRPIMYELAKSTGLTVFLGVVAGHEAMCMERIESASPIQVRIWLPGAKLPLNCGAAPRVLLAHLAETTRREVLAGHLGRLTLLSQLNRRALARDLQRIRTRGWEFVADDVAIGVAALGVPVFDRAGNVVAALSVSGLTHELGDPGGPRFLAELRRAAARLSPQLDDSSFRFAQ
jgi:DNA-binding IclR family transcriptional regulator